MKEREIIPRSIYAQKSYDKECIEYNKTKKENVPKVEYPKWMKRK